jgi:hypothetical protein
MAQYDEGHITAAYSMSALLADALTSVAIPIW